MKKISYEINGTRVEVEVTDEFAALYEQMDEEEKKRQADYIILNDGKSPLDTQIAALEEWLAHRKTGR